MFLKPKLHKESKMGSKQSITDPSVTSNDFFQKTVLWAKNHQKNWTFC
jgi:hypothetical protein